MCCIEGCVKIIVLLFNLVCALVGIGLIVLGVLYKVNFNEVTDAIPEAYDGLHMIPVLTIVIGCVIFLIAFFGCCGAWRDSPCLLTTYAVILLVIFVLQIALGVFVFLEVKDQNDLKDNVQKSIDKIFIEAQNRNKTDGVVGLIQQEFKCCGTTGPEFWGSMQVKSCYPNEDINNAKYTEGCRDKFYQFIQDSSQIIGITILVLSATEVIGAVVTLCLANSIRNENRRSRY